jgi:hypothetical protein
VATTEFDAIEGPLTRDEIRTALDSYAREWLGMSGEEFLAGLHAGDLDEFEPKIGQLALLARLLTD